MLGPQDITKEQAEASKEKTENTPHATLMLPVDEADLNRLAVARSLDIDSFDKIKENRERIDHVIHWAKLRGAKNQEDLIIEIKQLKNILGSPNLMDMVVFTGLDIQRMETAKRMNKLIPKHA